ncbi:His Kinase A (phospho-acceptor) domain-containing protein [Mesorhizobium sp. NFR06]|nr:His Kinase A (phospho-acceptor) domain-containing protein [Mesorhizobium sp. NFR06]
MHLGPLTVAQQRERATNRLAALGEMTGGIAHDFRNLLAVIESGLRLAEKRADEPERVRAYIAAARQGIDRGIELTSQLLAFAKHQELDTHAGDLNEFLRSFEPFLRYGAGPDVRVKLELGSDVPLCMVDPTFFDAAVLNLVINARDAVSNDAEVRVATGRLVQTTASPDPPGPGIYAYVRVEDRGCGMAPEVLQKVFDPFFTTKGEKGTGIGLSQVQAWLDMVGGRIRIASEQGIGTTVDLLFPSIEAEA